MKTRITLLPENPRRRRWTLASLAFLLPWLIWQIDGRWRPLYLYEPRAGDVVFQSLPATTGLVRTIEGVSRSPYSHCGIVARKGSSWVVIEALGEVRETPLWRWISRGRRGALDVYRLRASEREHVQEMIAAARARLGLPYDYLYRMDAGALYCSELVYRAWQEASGDEMGELVALGDLNWEPHREFIEFLEGGPAPLERRMITPAKLAASEHLEPLHLWVPDGWASTGRAR